RRLTMTHITFTYDKALPFLNQSEIDNLGSFLQTAHDDLHNQTGAGSDFLGWINLPKAYDQEEFARIKASAERIKQDTDIQHEIESEGSYIVARAAIEMLNNYHQNLLYAEERQAPQVSFIRHQMNSTYMTELFEILENEDVSINVNSKSGTRTEPAIAF